MKLEFESHSCALSGLETWQELGQANSPAFFHQVLLSSSFSLSRLAVTQAAFSVSSLALPLFKARFIGGVNQLSNRCLLSSSSIIQYLLSTYHVASPCAMSCGEYKGGRQLRLHLQGAWNLVGDRRGAGWQYEITEGNKYSNLKLISTNGILKGRGKKRKQSFSIIRYRVRFMKMVRFNTLQKQVGIG